jgi:hypothetical protein
MSDTRTVRNVMTWMGFDKDEPMEKWLAHVMEKAEPCDCYIAFDGGDDVLCEEWKKEVRR